MTSRRETSDSNQHRHSGRGSAETSMSTDAITPWRLPRLHLLLLSTPSWWSNCRCSEGPIVVLLSVVLFLIILVGSVTPPLHCTVAVAACSVHILCSRSISMHWSIDRYFKGAGINVKHVRVNGGGDQRVHRRWRPRHSWPRSLGRHSAR